MQEIQFDYEEGYFMVSSNDLYVKAANGNQVKSSGKWISKKQAEIEKKVIIGECKFKNEKIDKGIYETLIRRGKQITAKYEMSRYILFSLSGYTEWFDNLSDEKVILLTLDSLYE